MPADALERLSEALSTAAGVPIELERPSDPAHGDYATNAAMRLARERRRPPRELADELAEALATVPEVERADVAGPGFVNLWVTDRWLTDAAAEILARGRDYGAGDPRPPLRVQVELVSANPTGPITVAHA